MRILIQKFLINEFGLNSGNKIYVLQQKKLEAILSVTRGKSNNQLKTLTRTILPRISLYKVLQEEFDNQKKAYDMVKNYMFTIAGAKLNKQYSKLEIIPGYFYIFRKIMADSVKKVTIGQQK